MHSHYFCVWGLKSCVNSITLWSIYLPKEPSSRLPNGCSFEDIDLLHDNSSSCECFNFYTMLKYLVKM